MRRSLVAASIIASCTALLSAAGCVSGQNGSLPGGKDSGGGNSGGSGASAPTGGSGANGSGGGSATGNGGAAPTGGMSATGGSFPVTGGTSSGGTFSGSGGLGTSGTGTGAAGGKPCVDVEPPPDPDWPGATCRNWATETTECSMGWFAPYCDVSCGRCTPAGGGGATSTGGSGGSGPMGGSGGSGGKACVDVQPPPDPEWPGATCENWATETTACTEGWFANYCDVSCRRCTPTGGGGSGGGSSVVDCSGENLPNVTGGNGYATRYWDCCQPHCAQQTGHRCGQDGVSSTGDTNSACSGGGSFACYDEAPRAVSKCLSYGHIAKSNPNCGACYRIQFTGEGQHNVNDPGSKLIKGKQMIVKVTNTGGDVGGTQFDLMVPGGGVGQFNACSRQWGTSDLGAQYGGFLTNCTGAHSAKKECVRQNCMKIPAGAARDGCIWFVDWFEVADNPKFTSQQTNCPF